MKEIGGYFEMKFNVQESYYKGAIELNTARNCFEYILLAKKVKHIYIPHYICDVMLEPLNKHKIKFNYYNIDNNLDPILSESIKKDAFFLYTNYFGIKQKTINNLTNRISNLIIDNTMAFYARPAENIDTFYSARKFFGVPDGAYLFTSKVLDVKFEDDHSYDRMNHLFKRVELGANNSYEDFLQNDYKLYNQPIRNMSATTKLLLSQIDYSNYKHIRERNFLFLHSYLGKINELNFDLFDLNGPMFYPFLYDSEELKTKLIRNKIYVPTLWNNVLETANKKSFENYLTRYLLALPIDQRYTLEDMRFILKIIDLFHS